VFADKHGGHVRTGLDVTCNMRLILADARPSLTDASGACAYSILPIQPRHNGTGFCLHLLPGSDLDIRTPRRPMTLVLYRRAKGRRRAEADLGRCCALAASGGLVSEAGFSLVRGTLFPRHRLRKVSDLGEPRCAGHPYSVHKAPWSLHHK
jgi:hypothetical protein